MAIGSHDSLDQLSVYKMNITFYKYEKRTDDGRQLMAIGSHDSLDQQSVYKMNITFYQYERRMNEGCQIMTINYLTWFFESD